MSYFLTILGLHTLLLLGCGDTVDDNTSTNTSTTTSGQTTGTSTSTGTATTTSTTETGSTGTTETGSTSTSTTGTTTETGSTTTTTTSTTTTTTGTTTTTETGSTTTTTEPEPEPIGFSSCDATYTLIFSDGSDVTIDYCQGGTLDTTFEFDPDEAPSLRDPTLTLDGSNKGPFTCEIVITEPGLCGPGYYPMDGSSGAVTIDTSDCVGVPNAFEAVSESTSGYIRVDSATGGEFGGYKEGVSLATTFAGYLSVNTDNNTSLSGDFAVTTTLVATESGAISCTTDSGDNDGDGSLNIAYGGTDCDDSDPTLYGQDNDGDGFSPCDGDCDDTDADLSPVDADLDGYSTCDGDCDDADDTVSPADMDGDGTAGCDGDCDDTDPVLNINDVDGDGASSCANDCDDNDPALNIADADGDLSTTCDGDCDDANPDLESLDLDLDGYSTCNDDCDDTSPTAFPGAPEIFDDSIDQNCDGEDALSLNNFSGILTNVAEADLIGWELCFVDYYSDYSDISTIESLCHKDRMLMGCRYTGDTTLLVAAQALKTDVMYYTDTSNTGHVANDVEWYYSDTYSWGFVEPGDGMSRNSCDTASGSYPDHRVCFHTSSGSLSSGYRCGSNTSLNGATSHERVFYHANTAPDYDGDGFTADEDCNDADISIYPGAPEVINDGIDQDCDGIDLIDADLDGVTEDLDCDDTDASVYPGAPEVYGDGIDQDCDGMDQYDDDLDGSTAEFDCDDTDPTIYPGAPEIYEDGIDQDCDGEDAVYTFTFSGILTDVPESTLVGWDLCFSDYYADYSSITNIQAACGSDDLVIACRQTGSSTLTLAASAPAADVFYPTGTGNTGHVANGVEWYYDSSYSWGFVEPGDGMSRSSCDVGSGSYPEHRLCWHTSSTNISGGYRCGTTTSLNSSYSWERLVYKASPPADDDADGYPVGADCDDTDPSVYPGAPEIAGDGIDQDCDGVDLTVHDFTGIQTDLPEAALSGWDLCFEANYTETSSIVDITTACDKQNLLMGCRESGTGILTVAAQADRADVLYPTGTGDSGHVANGVEWYFDDSFSWGFAEPGDGILRANCDVYTGSYPEHRLCWHTAANYVSPGWRCGTAVNLNGEAVWERVMYQAD